MHRQGIPKSFRVDQEYKKTSHRCRGSAHLPEARPGENIEPPVNKASIGLWNHVLSLQNVKETRGGKNKLILASTREEQNEAPMTIIRSTPGQTHLTDALTKGNQVVSRFLVDTLKSELHNHPESSCTSAASTTAENQSRDVPAWTQLYDSLVEGQSQNWPLSKFPLQNRNPLASHSITLPQQTCAKCLIGLNAPSYYYFKSLITFC